MPHIITLNGDIIDSIRHNIEYSSHEKRKEERERLRFSHCLFLTQDSNGLNYQTATQTKIVRITDPTKITVPYPLAINLEPVYSVKSGPINLEIPDCTFATLRTHNDPHRPDYIKASDLTTSVVKMGDKKTNLEYLNNVHYYTSRLNHLMYTSIEYDIIDNAFTHEWDTDSLTELAPIFQPDYTSWNPFMHKLSENAEHKKNTANKILKQISKFGYIYRTKYDDDGNERVIEQPVAVFEKTLDNKHVTALILASKCNIK